MSSTTDLAFHEAFWQDHPELHKEYTTRIPLFKHENMLIYEFWWSKVQETNSINKLKEQANLLSSVPCR